MTGRGHPAALAAVAVAFGVSAIAGGAAAQPTVQPPLPVEIPPTSPAPPPLPPPDPDPGPGSAVTVETTARHTVISLPLMALSSNAIAIQVERPIAPRFGAAIALGLRDGADGDYQSTTYAIGGDIRWWRNVRQRGWFVGPRLELAMIRMSAGDRGLGTAPILTGGVIGGYRVVIVDRVELTANVGFAARYDVGHDGIPAQIRPTILYGVAAGWVF